MGNIPYGKAEKKSQISAITEIMLNGINLFVSLLSEQEERSDQKIRKQKSIMKLIPLYHQKALYAIGSSVADTKMIIADFQLQLDALNLLEIYPENEKKIHIEKMRLIARIKVAGDKMRKGEMQKKKLPMKVKWVRKAVCGDAESYTPNDILPILWYLEDQLSKGTNIFLYCDNMHGRVGMIAGCLLGRLYGLTLTNTLYRIQACHDCAKSESYLTTTKNPPVNCPNKSIYRGLIADVLELSNRPFEGTYGHTYFHLF